MTIRRPPSSGRLLLSFALWTLLVHGLASCASVRPRFSQEVATSFVREPMRKLTTASAEIYYPARYHDAAQRVVARLEHCLERLRSLPITKKERDRAVIYLTSANFNNAYVGGGSGGEMLHSVNPLFVTSELFHLYNLGNGEVGDIACHEMVHYVQFEQDNGLWSIVNTVAGNTLPPQVFLERWFLEGIAQYYEGRLEGNVGRPHSAFYRAAFEAGVASRGGKLHGGDLQSGQRELLPFSGAYLTGLHFVEYLAETYGDQKLWELIDKQSYSWFSPFWVTLRCKAIYGKSIGALLDDYSDALKKSVQPRPRPEAQRVLAESAGYFARLAGSPADGALAVVSAGLDERPQLQILERDGSVRLSRPINELRPGRRWVGAHPSSMSGLSFTADGRWLFAMNEDISIDGESQSQLWKVDTQTGDVEQVWDGFSGAGGSVRPDGLAYVYVEVEAGGTRLVELDLASGERRPLTELESGRSLGAPAYSPDGRRIAFAAKRGDSFQLYLREADGAQRQLTSDGAFNYAPKWIDAQRLLFTRVEPGPRGRLQAHLLELSTGTVSRVSEAPFVALDASPFGGGDFAFLNRDGWGWTVDAAPIEPLSPPARAEATTAAEPAPVAAPAPPEPPAAPAASAPPVSAVSDEGYSSLDHLFLPTLHAPFAYACQAFSEGAQSLNLCYGLSLRGQDRLGFHQWAFNAELAYPSPDNRFSFGYGTPLLAPWYTSLGFSRSQLNRTTDLVGRLRTSRSVWATPIFFDALAIDRRRAATDTDEASHARFVGAGVGFDYFAGDGTPYAGTQRALGFAGSVEGYPRAFGSDFTLGDVQGEVRLAPPLPLLKRHSLMVVLRGRAVLGGPFGILSVGGIPRGSNLWSNTEGNGEPAPSVSLPGMSFAEALRGYEDFAIRASSVATAHARYRYPLIIDYGWASTLYLLPSLFLRQVDLEAFGALASSDSPTYPMLRSVGGAVTFRSLLGGTIGISLFYQLAARLDAGLPPLHQFGFAFE